MKHLLLMILCTALGCAPAPEVGLVSGTKATGITSTAIDVDAVDSIWKTDKPEIQRLGYELLQQLVQAESTNNWIVPTEPIIVDEIDTTRNLNDTQYVLAFKYHPKLCRLEDVYHAPGWGVVHKQTKEQAWLFRLSIRFCNNGRLYIYDYSFHHGNEAAHGTGLIDYDEKNKTFIIKPAQDHWISKLPNTPLNGTARTLAAR